MNDATVPTAAMARDIATRATGEMPVSVERFTTGSQHYVFDVRFSVHRPIVVRMSRAADAHLARSASRLSHALRPLGVPLPAILAEDLAGPVPYQVLERLPGRDLGQVIDGLSSAQLKAIAGHVADAQARAALMPSASRYGYAASPERAPHARWSDLQRAGIDRSRQRIRAAGLFDPAIADRLDAVLATLPEADAQAATPFLHDTTTKNVIIADDGTFSGIVDVDDLCYGDPRSPIALTTAALTAWGGPLAYPASWLDQAHLADDRLFRFYVAAYLFDFMSEHGQVFNGNERPSRHEDRVKLLGQFEAALAVAE